MNFGKKKALSAALTVALGLAGSAQAIDFRVNGVTLNDVANFDWSVGNALAVGGANTDVGDTFQLLSHGALGNYTDSTNSTILPNAGLNLAYEITYVTSFEEQVFASAITPMVGGSQSFLTTGQNTNFFEIWYDDTPDADMLGGTGFNNGTLIASGTIQANGVGNFTSLFVTPEDLDQFGGTNDYAGIATATGVGGTNFDVVVNFGFYDTSFFINGIGPLEIAFNTSQALPFEQADPSALFVDTAGGAAPTQPGATVASIGALNGVDGPNVILQVDANSALDVEQVPAPAPLALLGLGLLGFGVSRRMKSA